MSKIIFVAIQALQKLSQTTQIWRIQVNLATQMRSGTKVVSSFVHTAYTKTST